MPCFFICGPGENLTEFPEGIASSPYWLVAIRGLEVLNLPGTKQLKRTPNGALFNWWTWGESNSQLLVANEMCCHYTTGPRCLNFESSI